MKSSLLLAILFFSISVAAQTGSKSSGIIFLTEIKSPAKDNFDFVIKNESDSLQYYYIGLEVYHDTSWYNTVLDINMLKDYRMAKISKIKPHETIRIVPNTHKIYKMVHGQTLLQRLKIVYGNSMDSRNRYTYSNPFYFARL